MCVNCNPSIVNVLLFFFFQAEDGIRDLVRSRGLGDVYKRQGWQVGGTLIRRSTNTKGPVIAHGPLGVIGSGGRLSLIHI